MRDIIVPDKKRGSRDAERRKGWEGGKPLVLGVWERYLHTSSNVYGPFPSAPIPDAPHSLTLPLLAPTRLPPLKP